MTGSPESWPRGSDVADVIPHFSRTALKSSSGSPFHALQEAAKSIPERLRRQTNLGSDGEDLYTSVFGSKPSAPLVQINKLSTDSEQSEHRGFKNLLTGIHGHYRNLRAHSTRLGSVEDKQDFLDTFALFSYVHRRLDAARVKP